MRDIVVSKRYALALYGSLKSLEDKNRVIEDFQKLKYCLDASPELSKIVKNPVIKKSDKLKAMEAISATLSLSKEVKDFLLLLVNKNRLSLFAGIYDALIQLYNDEMGVTEADLVVASALNENLYKEIESTLSKVTGKKIILNVKVDANIIGGFCAKVKSSLYDASIKGQLNKLSEKMLEV